MDFKLKHDKWMRRYTWYDKIKKNKKNKIKQYTT